MGCGQTCPDVAQTYGGDYGVMPTREEGGVRPSKACLIFVGNRRVRNRKVDKRSRASEKVVSRVSSKRSKKKSGEPASLPTSKKKNKSEMMRAG